MLQDPPGCGAVAGVGRGGTELVLTRNFPRQPFGRAGGEGTAARAGRAHARTHVLKSSLGARCSRGQGWGQLGTICRGSPGICPHGGFIPPAVPAMVRGHSWVPGGAQVGTGGCPPLTITVPQPPATSTAGFGALWPCQQGDAVASWTPRLGSPEPSVAPLPQILPERWQSLSAFTPPPAARHPTPGSPRGYLTPSLSSSFLRAGGRSAASHIPKETVGSFEKVGLALGCLFIAPRARRSHASVPQRSCTGLFIFPLLRFPLGRPS